MITDQIRDLLTSGDFGIGVVLGSVALVVVLITARAREDAGDESPAPIVGLLIAGAGAVAIASSSELPWRVVLGLALLAASRSLRIPAFLFVPLALGGGVVVASAVPNGPWWIGPALVGTVTIGGLAAASFDRRSAASGLGPVLFALSSVGVYVTVPETNAALALVGVSVPLAFAGWPRVHARLGDAGVLAAVGLLGWVAATGGTPRPSAVIGGLACLGVLVVEPASRALLGARGAGRVPAKWAVAALHVVAVLLVARVAGLRSSAAAALIVASAVLVAASVVMAWLIRAARPSR